MKVWGVGSWPNGWPRKRGPRECRERWWQASNIKVATMGSSSGLRYRRLLLKLSGEALMGKSGYGIDVPVVQRLSGEIRDAIAAGAAAARGLHAGLAPRKGEAVGAISRR